MPLSAGDKLGPYEILAPIGAGGMGDVYKARDTRLDRIVAVKVSKTEFSERFEREARAVAALNHSNICTLYDVGPNYLVMEYIEGAALKGPLPIDQALKYAAQICDALDAAHKKGITHRDLKPANILVTKSGIKLLDFGLAKIGQSVKPLDDATLTMALTGKNEIVGTLYYMSPEQLQAQATGQEIDGRSDIFSFGLVLYEMLTGKRAFEGSSPASVIAAIMERPAPSIGAVAPPALERLLQRCLKKDPEERWQTARDLKAELEWIATGPSGDSEAAVPTPASGRSASARWAWLAAALFLIGGITVATIDFTQRPAPQPVVRFTVLPPEGGLFPGTTPRLAISPDGSQLAFQFPGSQGKQQIWVRRLDATESHAIPGTEDAETPFWSADSHSIGFFANNKLKRVDAAGGPVQTLCDGPGSDGGGTWNTDGTILFSGRNPETPVTRVSASGGTPVPVTKLASGETFHRWPRFLPDGRHFLYFATFTNSEQDGVFLSSLDGMPPKRILTTRYMADYASGYLLYRLDQALMARPFDEKKFEFTGEAIQVLSSVGVLANNGRVGFSVSNNGYLAFAENFNGDRSHLVWLDRTGKESGEVGAPGTLGEPRLSPDGKQVVFIRADGGQGDVWLVDLARGVPSRLTFREGGSRYPVWSPDGKTVAFSSAVAGTSGSQLFRKAVSGLGEDELLFSSDSPVMPTDFSPDGRFLLYAKNPNASGDIYALPLTLPAHPLPNQGPAPGKAEPVPVQVTSFDEGRARFSPDGRWIALVSNESGPNQVYVRSFPGNERKVQISSGPSVGIEPQWRHDGKELYYISRDDASAIGKMMAVPIKSLNPFEAGLPVPLFTIPTASTFPTFSHYTASPDGSKFLVIAPVNVVQARPITIVQNWIAALRTR